MYCKCSYLRVVVIYTTYVVNIKLHEIPMRMEKTKLSKSIQSCICVFNTWGYCLPTEYGYLTTAVNNFYST